MLIVTFIGAAAGLLDQIEIDFRKIVEFSILIGVGFFVLSSAVNLLVHTYLIMRRSI